MENMDDGGIMTSAMKQWSGARLRIRGAVILVSALVVFQANPAWSASDTARAAGVGAAAALSSLVYGPVKLVYAALGGIVGGIAWGLSGGDSEVKDAVIMPAVRGDYVVTPANIRGEEKLEFVGRRPGYGDDEVVTSEVIDEGF
jgi:hypothetical protein